VIRAHEGHSYIFPLARLEFQEALVCPYFFIVELPLKACGHRLGERTRPV